MAISQPQGNDGASGWAGSNAQTARVQITITAHTYMAFDEMLQLARSQIIGGLREAHGGDQPGSSYSYTVAGAEAAPDSPAALHNADGLRARGEELLRALLKEYDALQAAKHNPGDDEEAGERLAEVVAQLALLVELLSIEQARLDSVLRVIINRDSEQTSIIHSYAVLQLYFAGQLGAFDDMICFQQPRHV
jgi:hypothetical protein